MGRPLNSCDVESQREVKDASSGWRGWTSVVVWSSLCYLCILLLIFGYFNPSLLPFDPTYLVFNKNVSPFFAFSRGSGHFPKPHGFDIVALVPFTNHERTAILDCYLQRNLVRNHGFLDQVVFFPQTHDPAGLEWLDSLARQTPEYVISSPGQGMEWDVAADNVMYIRVDGDVVFLENHTIPTIVKTMLDNPSASMVSANVVNEAALATLHSHPGVALPYLPELYRAEQPARAKPQLGQDWRTSSLPTWHGPASFYVPKDFKPPFQGHRWLLPAEEGFGRDPIAASIYMETGPSLDDWTVSAQQHYSFLHHVESGDLSRYKFPLWSDPTELISQNFGCFWGKDAEALRVMFDPGSSEGLHESWKERDDSRPHVVIDGKGLVSHYSARLGPAGLDSTDLLDRYRAYAQENVCSKSL